VVRSLMPGLHQISLSGAGTAPSEHAIEVRVNQTAHFTAMPALSPADGVLDIRATVSGDGGDQPLSGANVWVDGQPRGVTPLHLTLSRGPHSVRVNWHGEQPPVQVIDLPGGNQRYATFELGAGTLPPRFVRGGNVDRMPLDRATVISGTIEGVRPADLREMWLHVRTPDGGWRRYPMSTLPAPGGVVGVSVFPVALFDPQGRAAFYLSASTASGDEYFTEIETATATTAR
jgi:PEGA domain-containing protein